MKKIRLLLRAIRKKGLSRMQLQVKADREKTAAREAKIRKAAEARSDMHAKRNAERRERKAALKAGRGA